MIRQRKKILCFCGKLKCVSSKWCYSCRGKYNNPMKGKFNTDSPTWKGGIPKCLDCNIELSNYKVKNQRCKNCIAKFKVGKLHHRFGKLSSHGKGSYYKNIFFRSSWEVKFAKYLDKNKIKWLYESKTFDLGNTTYTPDFYLPKSNEYIEIKGWWRDNAIEKFTLFLLFYNSINIKVIEKNEMRNLKLI